MRRPLASLVRFAAVGVLSNLALYAAYVALTRVNVGPKPAMTLCFAAGVLFSFVLNRTWAFRSTAPIGPSLLRYAATYLAGYLLNLVGLIAFVDWWGCRHEIVQAYMVVVVAVLTFAAQRAWVFRRSPDETPLRSRRSAA